MDLKNKKKIKRPNFPSIHGFEHYPEGKLLGQKVDFDGPIGIAYERCIGYTKCKHTHDRITITFPRGSSRSFIKVYPEAHHFNLSESVVHIMMKDHEHEQGSVSSIYDTFAIFVTEEHYLAHLKKIGASDKEIKTFFATTQTFPKSAVLTEVVTRYFFCRVIESSPSLVELAHLESLILTEIFMLGQKASAKKTPSQKNSESTGATIIDETALVRSIEFIESHLFEKLDIGALVRSSRTSQATLFRLFKKELKASPIEYVRNRRLDEAKILLHTGQYQVSDVALLVGYEDLSSFSKAFKDRFKTAPSKSLPLKASSAVQGLIFLVMLFGGAAAMNASAGTVRVGCPNISVTSLEKSISFFQTTLDFKTEDQKDASPLVRSAPKMPSNSNAHSTRMTLGDECIELTEYKTPKGAPFVADSHGNDRWFEHIAIVVSDMDKAYERVRKAHVQFVSNAPQTLPEWNKNAAGISAFYFRDPDGHYLELIHFPKGKGQNKWRNPSDKLFLGIDHTAITVSNSERSLEFYRDKLHLHVVGGSENYGIEQEHLSGVFNAHVLITSLRGDSGMGIEFLEYLSPSGGRETPSNLKISDIPVWQIVIEEETPSSTPDKNPKISWLKDPDGHVLRMSAKK